MQWAVDCAAKAPAKVDGGVAQGCHDLGFSAGADLELGSRPGRVHDLAGALPAFREARAGSTVEDG
ncbi:hypothetical protein FHG89_11465 [Micromonospora orduensis]|uniref:Uncharacterized protein n=1 Tax=Micromonospora orduensis TaxID=1420891 RepID=A0A5C4QV86_9ACTN|nr:hypothetical protein [Micromonospora orduensis]TNH29620.1 hypothetical protein FHG89_11465 [Micromonospora orduensis]